MQALQSKHSKQQCKRHRAKTVTANSKASATRQTAPQPQPVPLSHRRNSHRGALSTSKCACPGGMNGEVGPRSGHAPSPPLRPVYSRPGLRGIGGAIFLRSQEGGTAGCMRWSARVRPLASLRRLWRRTNSRSNRHRGYVSRTSLVGRNGRLMSPLSCQHSFDHHIGTGNRGAGGLCAVVHCHYAVNSTIVGDSRPASGCCYRRAISW